MKDILREIDRLRLKRGWTEYELAKKSGLTQSTISGWYREKRIPTIATLDKVCIGLGITLSAFFAEGEDPVSLTPAQRALLDNWSALDENQQHIVMELLQNMGQLPKDWRKDSANRRNGSS
ncbi:MAG: helix-turn-helix transcriptional regulator [Clostridiaceae bacterium]|nr:helix-turn-helix transcriptional regulator [Clostridiaceae bacterium]